MMARPAARWTADREETSTNSTSGRELNNVQEEKLAQISQYPFTITVCPVNATRMAAETAVKLVNNYSVNHEADENTSNNYALFPVLYGLLCNSIFVTFFVLSVHV